MIEGDSRCWDLPISEDSSPGPVTTHNSAREEVDSYFGKGNTAGMLYLINKVRTMLLPLDVAPPARV